MKALFYLLIILLVILLVTDIYAFFNDGFFWSPFSKFINIITPVVLFIYLLVLVIKKRKQLNKLNEQR